jgi:hypothetical protein
MPVDTFDGPLNGELLAEASEHGDYLPVPRVPMQQVKTGYTTAIAVQQPRDLQVVNKRLMAEAKLAGESFYYGWGSGRERIEGPSIGLAMAAARCFGNSAVDALPIQETDDSWVMTAAYIDLETGFTLTRQFRQSKKSVVHGKHDNERKDDIRFQIGQSKAARNVVVNALPKWLIDAAVNEAKVGVRAKIEQYVASKGLPAAVGLVLTGLAKHGVTEPIVLDKCQVAKLEGLTIDHVVMLRGDLYALDSGQDYASALFPAMAEEKSGKVSRSSINDKLDKTPKKEATPEAPPADGMSEADKERAFQLEREGN